METFLVVATSMIVIIFPESNGKAAEALIAAPPYILVIAAPPYILD